jgi:hypothetical protein
MNYETDCELESDQVIYSNPYLNQIESNPGLVHLRSRASYLSSLGLYNDAIALIADEPLLANLSVILSMANDLGGNWNSADTSQIETLYAISNDLTDFSSGIVGGILDEIGDSLVEPEPNFPIQQRSLMNNENSSNPVLPLLGIYPNPAKDVAYIHYPIEADEHGFIRVLDVDGRLIEQINPASNGLLELSLTNYRNGIYIVELVAFDKTLESIKLVVVK